MRPIPTPVFHFTHVDNLANVLDHGLLADSVASARGLLQVEVGNVGIKDGRRARVVEVDPGGFVSDYVPFYFAPRSPMMYSIHRNNVPTYDGGCAELVYLVSTVESLTAAGCRLVFSDRNAVKNYAAFAGLGPVLDDLIDWPLMRAQYWNDTPQFPDRMERRMAECLAHESVPWVAVEQVSAFSAHVAERVTTLLADRGLATPVSVRPDWYFT